MSDKGLFELKSPWFGVKFQQKFYTIDEIKSMFNQILVLKDVPAEWKGTKLAVPMNPALGLPNNKNNHAL
jgi:hypothetical protein